MNKAEFLDRLRQALGRLPHYEADQSVSFYAEMIEDCIEDGMTEEEAVASLGNIDAIAAQISAETPIIPKTIAKANTGSRTLNIVLLIVFSPVWVPIAISLIAAALAIYLSIWAVIFSLWCVVFSLVLAGVIGMCALVYLIVLGHFIPAFGSLGIGLICAGIGLFCLFGVIAATKGLYNLTKVFAQKIRSLFVREGGQQ